MQYAGERVHRVVKLTRLDTDPKGLPQQRQIRRDGIMPMVAVVPEDVQSSAQLWTAAVATSELDADSTDLVFACVIPRGRTMDERECGVGFAAVQRVTVQERQLDHLAGDVTKQCPFSQKDRSEQVGEDFHRLQVLRLLGARSPEHLLGGDVGQERVDAFQLHARRVLDPIARQGDVELG